MDYGFFFYLSYVYPNREWFYNLKEPKSGSYMGNDQTCEMLGIGKIKLKLHDETICSMIEFWDV